jgi:hypothetical protein
MVRDKGALERLELAPDAPPRHGDPVPPEWLKQAASLQGTMPNGQKYEAGRKDKEGRGDDGVERSPS